MCVGRCVCLVVACCSMAGFVVCCLKFAGCCFVRVVWCLFVVSCVDIVFLFVCFFA